MNADFPDIMPKSRPSWVKPISNSMELIGKGMSKENEAESIMGI